jgi:hypothetical protein
MLANRLDMPLPAPSLLEKTFKVDGLAFSSAAWFAETVAFE